MRKRKKNKKAQQTRSLVVVAGGIFLTVFAVLFVTFSLTVWNNKKEGTDSDKINKLFQQSKTALAPTSIIVYKTKQDYYGLVPITLSSDKSKVVAFMDLEGKLPTKLIDNYLMDNGALLTNGIHGVFLDLSYQQYREMLKNNTLSVEDLLKEHIKDDKPFTELYACDDGKSHSHEEKVQIINDLINTHKLTSTCINLLDTGNGEGEKCPTFKVKACDKDEKRIWKVIDGCRRPGECVKISNVNDSTLDYTVTPQEEEKFYQAISEFYDATKINHIRQLLNEYKQKYPEGYYVIVKVGSRAPRDFQAYYDIDRSIGVKQSISIMTHEMTHGANSVCFFEGSSIEACKNGMINPSNDQKYVFFVDDMLIAVPYDTEMEYNITGKIDAILNRIDSGSKDDFDETYISTDSGGPSYSTLDEINAYIKSVRSRTYVPDVPEEKFVVQNVEHLYRLLYHLNIMLIEAKEDPSLWNKIKQNKPFVAILFKFRDRALRELQSEDLQQYSNDARVKKNRELLQETDYILNQLGGSQYAQKTFAELSSVGVQTKKVNSLGMQGVIPFYGEDPNIVYFGNTKVQLPNQGNPDQPNNSGQQGSDNQQDNSDQQDGSGQTISGGNHNTNTTDNSNQTGGGVSGNRGNNSSDLLATTTSSTGTTRTDTSNTEEDPCNSSIGNHIWYDSNGNGIQEDIEGGIVGVKVCAYHGNKKYCDTTDKHGRYKIKDLCSGTYTVIAKDVGNLIQTYDPDGSKDNKTRVKLKEDDKHTKADFGYRGRAPKTGNATNVVVLLILSTLATIGLIFLMRKKGMI